MGLHVFFVHAVMGLDIMIYYDMIMNRNVQPAEQPFRTYNYLSLFLDDLIFLFFLELLCNACVCVLYIHMYVIYCYIIHTQRRGKPKRFPIQKVIYFHRGCSTFFDMFTGGQISIQWRLSCHNYPLIIAFLALFAGHDQRQALLWDVRLRCSDRRGLQALASRGPVRCGSRTGETERFVERRWMTDNDDKHAKNLWLSGNYTRKLKVITSMILW